MSTIKMLRLGVVALTLALFTACGGGKAKDPKGVAEAFLNAMAEQDWSTAKKYATAGSQEAIDQVAEMAESMKGLEDLAGEESETPEIKMGDVTEEGETAVVSYTEDGSEKQLNLVKEEGEWKVEFSKMGGMDDMGDMSEGLEEMDEALEGLEGLGDSLSEAMEELEEVTGQ